jgi:hypothetical protein
MTKFVFALAFLAATAAHASSVQVDQVDAVYEASTSSVEANVSLDSFKFEINPSMGRARLDITYTSDYSGGGDDGGFYAPGEDDVLVKGLSFDTSTSQVVYTNDRGKVTSCATVTISHNLFGQKIKVRNTGLCTLSTQIGDVATDDGFQIHHRAVLNVFLNVQD